MKAITISELHDRLSEYVRPAPDAPVHIQLNDLPDGALFYTKLETDTGEGARLFLVGVSTQ